MCGISGILKYGLEKNDHEITTFEYMYKMLYLLQTRGYDSVGICSINNDNYNISKYSVNEVYAKKQGLYIFDLLKLDYEKHDSNIMIGHTRWATIGKKDDMNAHPHISNNKKIVLVHNGHLNFENYKIISDILLKKGYKFYGDTDSELICNYLEYHQKINPKKKFDEIVYIVSQKLSGIWSCLIFNLDYPETIFFMKNGMPLVLSKSLKDKYVFASDPNTFIENVNEYYLIMDDTYGYVNRNGVYISEYKYKIMPHYINTLDFDIHKGDKLFDTNYIWTLQNLDNMMETITNTQYEYVIKEYNYDNDRLKNLVIIKNRYIKGNIIHEKSETSNNITHNLDVISFPTLELYKSIFITNKNIILIGCGTSLHTCMCAKIFMQEMEIFDNIDIINACEYTVYDILKNNVNIYIVVNQNSENRDISNLIKYIKNTNSDTKKYIFGIFNNNFGNLAMNTDSNILLNSGKDFAYSFVKSFISQYITLYLFSVWIKQQKKMKLTYELHQLKYLYENFDINTTIKKQHLINTFSKQMLESLKKGSLLFLIGKGNMYPICLEGAMKIKDMSHIYCQGCSIQEVRYGYYNILNTNTTILLLIDKHKNYNEMLTLIEEFRTKEILSNVYLITNEYDSQIINRQISDKNILYVEDTSFLEIRYMFILLYIAYYFAINQNINPDRPNNFHNPILL